MLLRLMDPYPTKLRAAVLTLFCLVTHLCSAQSQTQMSPQTALANYIEKINTHAWEQIAPLITDDAVFVFTEGTFVGKAAAKAAFEKTFDLIKEEQFALREISWSAITDSMAACHYEFRWKGVIEGQAASGGGRGTSILVRKDGQWLIAHEHLGPYPRQ